MPFRFRPRIGPFVYVPPRRATRPNARIDDRVQVILVLVPMSVIGILALLFAVTRG